MLLWDNTQVLHHSFDYENDGTNVREYYRTQYWPAAGAVATQVDLSTATDAGPVRREIHSSSGSRRRRWSRCH